MQKLISKWLARREVWGARASPRAISGVPLENPFRRNAEHHTRDAYAPRTSHTRRQCRARAPGGRADRGFFMQLIALIHRGERAACVEEDLIGPTRARRSGRSSAPRLAQPISPGEKSDRLPAALAPDPQDRRIKTGTLAGILKRIAAHQGLTVEELLQKLDLQAAISQLCPALFAHELLKVIVRLLPPHAVAWQTVEANGVYDRVQDSVSNSSCTLSSRRSKNRRRPFKHARILARARAA